MDRPFLVLEWCWLDEFDLGHFGAVSTTGAKLGNAQIAAGTFCVPRCNIIEQLGHGIVVLNLLEHRATSVQITAASLGDYFLGVRPKNLCLCVCRGNELVLNEISRQIRQNLALMLR